MIKFYYISYFFILFLFFFENLSANERDQILMIKEGAKDCHNLESENNLKCSNDCVSCHGESKKHHKINVRMQGNIPEQLILDSFNKVTCETCHNIELKRFDTKPWKSQSMFEDFFGKKEKYRTYFLRLNNQEGQLCKVCH